MEQPSKEEFDAQVEEEVSARSILEEVLPHSDSIDNILILMRDSNGATGFVTNVNSFEESLAFIERVKHGMMDMDSEGSIE